MPNHAVQAAAEGLPKISRRTMLSGIAAIAATSPALAEAAADLRWEAVEREVAAENPELIRLDDGLPAIEAEYADAVEHERVIIAKWGPRWPSCPEILYCGWGGYGSIERDLTGWRIGHKDSFGTVRSRSIWTAVELQSRVEWANQSIRRSRTEKSRARATEDRDSYLPLLSAATRYETECARIHSGSGYKAAHARRTAAEERLTSHVVAVLREPAETMTGIVIQARALNAASRLSFLHRAAAETTNDINWAATLAASIVRIAA